VTALHWAALHLHEPGTPHVLQQLPPHPHRRVLASHPTVYGGVPQRVSPAYPGLWLLHSDSNWDSWLWDPCRGAQCPPLKAAWLSWLACSYALVPGCGAHHGGGLFPTQAQWTSSVFLALLCNLPLMWPPALLEREAWPPVCSLCPSPVASVCFQVGGLGLARDVGLGWPSGTMGGQLDPRGETCRNLSGCYVGAHLGKAGQDGVRLLLFQRCSGLKALLSFWKGIQVLGGRCFDTI
jgi:hypothetical protein